jgi:hypothetical protein
MKTLLFDEIEERFSSPKCILCGLTSRGRDDANAGPGDPAETALADEDNAAMAANIAAVIREPNRIRRGSPFAFEWRQTSEYQFDALLHNLFILTALWPF